MGFGLRALMNRGCGDQRISCMMVNIVSGLWRSSLIRPLKGIRLIWRRDEIETVLSLVRKQLPTMEVPKTTNVRDEWFCFV